MSAVLASLIHFNLTNQCINQNKHTKGQKSLKKIVVLESSKKRTLGQFYELKIAPVFVFWKNPVRHNLLLRFTDLYQKTKLKKSNSLQLMFSEIYLIYVCTQHYYNFCILGIQHSKLVCFQSYFFISFLRFDKMFVRLASQKRINVY